MGKLNILSNMWLRPVKERVSRFFVLNLGKEGVQMVDMITEAEFYQQYREKTDRAAKQFCFARDRRKVVDVIQKRYPILNDYIRALLLENEMLLTVAKNGGFS
ncbi:MAG: hypothetical protein K6E51_14630 [Treponema sp.]|nr:hypothetical protein [Treponema sp.]